MGRIKLLGDALLGGLNMVKSAAPVYSGAIPKEVAARELGKFYAMAGKKLGTDAHRTPVKRFESVGDIADSLGYEAKRATRNQNPLGDVVTTTYQKPGSRTGMRDEFDEYATDTNTEGALSRLTQEADYDPITEYYSRPEIRGLIQSLDGTPARGWNTFNTMGMQANTGSGGPLYQALLDSQPTMNRRRLMNTLTQQNVEAQLARYFSQGVRNTAAGDVNPFAGLVFSNQLGWQQARPMLSDLVNFKTPAQGLTPARVETVMPRIRPEGSSLNTHGHQQAFSEMAAQDPESLMGYLAMAQRNMTDKALPDAIDAMALPIEQRMAAFGPLAEAARANAAKVNAMTDRPTNRIPSPNEMMKAGITQDVLHAVQRGDDTGALLERYLPHLQNRFQRGGYVDGNP